MNNICFLLRCNSNRLLQKAMIEARQEYLEIHQDEQEVPSYDIERVQENAQAKVRFANLVGMKIEDARAHYAIKVPSGSIVAHPLPENTFIRQYYSTNRLHVLVDDTLIIRKILHVG